MGFAAKMAAAGCVTNQAANLQQNVGAVQTTAAGNSLGETHQALGHQQAAVSGSSGDAFGPIIHQKLSAVVASNSLQAFYSAAALQEITRRLLLIDWRGLAARWHLPVELALDLCGLALYDIVVYCDDSGSMRFAEDGTRIQDLQAILDRVTSVATMFDADGIALRAMNFKGVANNVTSPAQAADFVAQFKYDGLTPLGEMLEKRVIEPILEKAMKKKQLRKPVLVITITDGEPSERPGKVQSEIAEAKRHCKRSMYGQGAIAFAFAQVGKDEGAQRFLATLDNDKDVGQMVDCTSYFDLEQAECAKKGVNLTPDMWMLKLMVGGFDKSYDARD